MNILITFLFISICGQLFSGVFKRITYALELIVLLFAVLFLPPVILETKGYYLWIVPGVLMGYCSFGISILITSLSFKKTWKYLSRIKNLLIFIIYRWKLGLFLLASALYEECVWRGIIQTNIQPIEIGLIATAVFFTIRHNDALAGNTMHVLDFFCFSLLLGVFYWLWHSLIFISAIHYIRNMGVLYYHSMERILYSSALTA